MLRKIFNMQKLLVLNITLPFGSGYRNSLAEKKYTNYDMVFASMLLIISSLYYFIIDQSMIFIVIASFTSLMIGTFAGYNSDIIALIPVSKRFAFFNLQIAGLLSFVISSLLFGLSILVIFCIEYISDLIFPVGNTSNSLVIFISEFRLESSLFFLLIILLYYAVIFTIMFIKKSVIRLAAGISFSTGYLVLLDIFKKRMSYYPNTLSVYGILNKFQLLPNRVEMLRTYGLSVAAIFILLLVISYHSYKGKRKHVLQNK